MSSDTAGRRTHTDSRTSENFNENGLTTLTGQNPSKWGRYVLKELLDNALDFGGESPEITVEMDLDEGARTRYTVDRILVRDDGVGIDEDSFDDIFANPEEFAGSKRHYARTDRGKQGNALMTILGIQYLCGEPLRLETRGMEYRITTVHNAMDDAYETTTEQVGESDVEGTLVEVRFEDDTDVEYTDYNRMRTTVSEFVSLNPHANFDITIDAFGDLETSEYAAVENPTAQSLTMRGGATTGKASWFSLDGFTERLKADVRVVPELAVKDFVGEFLGVAGREQRTAVVDAFASLGFGDVTTIADFFDDSGQERDKAIPTLYAAMCNHTTSFAESGLETTIGSVGEDLTNRLPGDTEDVYNRLEREGEINEKIAEREDLSVYHSGGGVMNEESDGKTTPFYFEVAAAPTGFCTDGEPTVDVVFGTNQSVLYSNPSFHYNAEFYVSHEDGSSTKSTGHWSIGDAFERVGHNISVVCNLTCPNIEFEDKGKQGFTTRPFESVMGDVVTKVVRKLERDIRPRLNAAIAEPAPEDPEPEKTLEGRADKSFIGDFIEDHFWEVYDEATDSGRFPLTLRDFYYAIHGPLMEEADRRGYKYTWNSPTDDPQPFQFTQATSNRHVRAFETEELGHRLLHRDDRGFFVEPHTGREIALGTEAVDNYDATEVIEEVDALLYIEKTGRMNIIGRTDIAKEYDIGIINGKGYATLATRKLIETIQAAATDADRQIPLYTVTDFDAEGVLIRENVKEPDDLSEVDEFDVQHIGITLDDIEDYDLDTDLKTISESQQTKLENAHEDGTVDDATYEFLTANGGQRVEINALAPTELIDYLKAHFEQLDISKVAPDDADEVQDAGVTTGLDFEPPDDIREDSIAKGVGNWVMQQRSKVFTPLSDDFDTDQVLEPCIRRVADDGTVLEPCIKRVVEHGGHTSQSAALGAELGDDSLSENVETLPRDDDEAATEVYEQTLEKLEDNPPKTWESVAGDVADDLRDEYGGDNVKKYRRSIKFAIEEYLSQNYEFEMRAKTDTDDDAD